MNNEIIVIERQILISGIKIWTRILETGEHTKPVILFLHGNPDCADEWIPLMHIFGKTHHCIAPDIPGYGKSPEPPSSFDYSVKAQVDFLDALLLKLDIHEKIILMVHDIGAVMGIAWGGKHTEQLKGMVITNTFVFTGFNWFPNARTWSNTSTFGRIRAKTSMWAIGQFGGSLFKRILSRQNRQLGKTDLERITKRFALNEDAKRSTLRQFQKMTHLLYFNEFKLFIQRITSSVPCLVVWGDNDPYIPVKWALLFENATLEIIHNGGHWIAITAPDKLAELFYKHVFRKDN